MREMFVPLFNSVWRVLVVVFVLFRSCFVGWEARSFLFPSLVVAGEIAFFLVGGGRR